MGKVKKIPFKYIIMLVALVVILMGETLFSTYSYFKYSLPSANEIALDGEVADIDSVIVLEQSHSVGVLAGDTTTVEVNITNSTTSTLYYACWYEVLSGSSTLTTTLVSSSATSSTTIAASTTYNVVFKITNSGSSDVIVSVGASGSKTSTLNLTSDQTSITVVS